jgi:GxxExxY protein
LRLRRLRFERQRALPLIYKGVRLDCGYRLDFVVSGCLILELKAVERIQPVHKVQVLTYLRLTGLWLGLLINFNVPILEEGLRRVVN